MKKHFLQITIVLCTLLFIHACEDIEDDFTIGNFYPIDSIPERITPDTISKDTTFVNPQNCWASGVKARHNATYNRYFTRYANGWTGGDATYSIPIAAGVNLWLFGDTFLGSVNEDRSRSGTPLINNSIVLQDGEEFTTFYSEQENQPKAFLSPPEEDWWYWPGHGQMHNGNVQLIMFAMKRTNESGIFSFDYAALDIYELSFPELEVLNYKRHSLFEGKNFGACLLQFEGHTYIYGMEKTGWHKYLHVARIEGTDLFNNWSYFAGANNWSEYESESQRIFADVSDQFSVIQRGTAFYVMTQDHFLGRELYLYKGNAPTSTFADKKIIYCTPETQGNIFTYNAFVHEQFSAEDKLFISYNNNSRIFADLFRNADNYRPHFVEITGWRD